jgi:hypothetical protein
VPLPTPGDLSGISSSYTSDELDHHFTLAGEAKTSVRRLFGDRERLGPDETVSGLLTHTCGVLTPEQLDEMFIKLDVSFPESGRQTLVWSLGRGPLDETKTDTPAVPPARLLSPSVEIRLRRGEVSEFGEPPTRCANCTGDVSDYETPRYCPDCGQFLALSAGP